MSHLREGGGVRWFEDVDVGDRLGPMEKRGDQIHITMYQAATWDFHRSHYDAEWTRAQGFGGPFMDGQQLGAYLAQLAIGWAGGDPGTLKRLHLRYRELVRPGDVLTCDGQVSEKRVDQGRHIVVCNLRVVNQVGQAILSAGSAAMEIPSRGE